MQGQPGPQGKHSDDVKQRIIDAAIELFANKGYDASSISDISSSAGVNRALIYYYFKDKRDLYYTILKGGNDAALRIAKEAYISEGSAIDRLRVFITGFSRMRVEQDKNIGRIIMRGIVDNSPDIEKHMDDNFFRVSSILAKILEEGIASGELRDLDPEKMIHIILGLSHSLFMMQMKQITSDSLENNVENVMSILTNGIINPSR